MKIVCISDTHGFHRKLEMPEGDVLIHAGDFSNMGNIKAVQDFNSWLGELPYKYKYVIPGNHDRCFENVLNLDHGSPNKNLMTNCDFLMHNSLIEQNKATITTVKDNSIESISIWGFQYCLKYGDWSFMYQRKDGRKLWNTIREENIDYSPDIIISHGPPYGILDLVPEEYFDRNEGCSELRDFIKFYKPKLCVVGHIHESYGIHKENGTTYINACIWNHRDNTLNKPIVYEYES